MIKRTPDDQLREQLEFLDQAPAFQAYLAILGEALQAHSLQLNQLRATSEGMAQHNWLVGHIEGIRKAMIMVRTLLAQQTRDEERQEQADTQGSFSARSSRGPAQR